MHKSFEDYKKSGLAQKLRDEGREIFGHKGVSFELRTGSIENEDAHQTALREINEETGLTPIQFWVVPNINSFYSPERDVIVMIPVFAVLVNGKQKVIISDEHSEFKWVKKEEAIKLLAWPGQRQSVEIIYEYFTNQQSFLKFVEIHL